MVINVSSDTRIWTATWFLCISTLNPQIIPTLENHKCDKTPGPPSSVSTAPGCPGSTTKCPGPSAGSGSLSSAPSGWKPSTWTKSNPQVHQQQINGHATQECQGGQTQQQQSAKVQEQGCLAKQQQGGLVQHQHEGLFQSQDGGLAQQQQRGLVQHQKQGLAQQQEGGVVQTQQMEHMMGMIQLMMKDIGQLKPRLNGQ